MAFNYTTGSAPVSEIVKSLATALTTGTSDIWTMEYPATASAVTTVAILSTTTTFAKKFYAKFERAVNALNYMMVTIGTELLGDKTDFAVGKHDIPSRWAWYRDIGELEFGDYLPVKYWLSFNKDFANIVIQGDPSADITPYNRNLRSACLLGSLQSYEGAAADTVGNFFKTVGSDIPPTQTMTFGANTATGVNDISFVATKSGMPYQRHSIKYFADNAYMDKYFIESSAYTGKEHSSALVVTHHTERERGMIQNALVLDRAAMQNLTELTLTTGEVYLMFMLNAPFNFMDNSANPTYGIAIRKV